jgi:protein required for attachment to host cells
MQSMKNWLLIANAARARVLEVTAQAGHYRHVADLVHPQSRQKGVELADDRLGHVKGSAPGPGGAAYAPRTGPRERERDRFAQQVAQHLNKGIASGQCAGLVLVASNPFLGELKSHLSEQGRKALLRTVASDLTAVADADLAHRLGTG